VREVRSYRQMNLVSVDRFIVDSTLVRAQRGRTKSKKLVMLTSFFSIN